MTVHRVRHENGGNYLVSCCCNSHPDQRRDVPCVAGIVELDQENDDTDDAEHKTKVAQPQPVLWLRAPSAQLLSPHGHPEVRHAAADLLPDNGANNDRDHLQAVLLGVEAEEFGEELRDLDGGHDTRPEEFHGVGDGWKHDAGSGCVGQWLNKIVPGHRGLVDPAEAHVLLLEIGLIPLIFGCLASANVTRLWPKEKVEGELNRVRLCRLAC